MLLLHFSCDILVKKVAAFCHCPRSLSETKVKRFGLIPLAEEISKQPSLDSALWSLELMIIMIYNEKEQLEQRKGTPGSGKELSPVLKVINRLRNGIKDVVTSGQKSHLSFQFIKRN